MDISTLSKNAQIAYYTALNRHTDKKGRIHLETYIFKKNIIKGYSIIGAPNNPISESSYNSYNIKFEKNNYQIDFLYAYLNWVSYIHDTNWNQLLDIDFDIWSSRNNAPLQGHLIDSTSLEKTYIKLPVYIFEKKHPRDKIYIHKSMQEIFDNNLLFQVGSLKQAIYFVKNMNDNFNIFKIHHIISRTGKYKINGMTLIKPAIIGKPFTNSSVDD